MKFRIRVTTDNQVYVSDPTNFSAEEYSSLLDALKTPLTYIHIIIGGNDFIIKGDVAMNCVISLIKEE